MAKRKFAAPAKKIATKPLSAKGKLGDEEATIKFNPQTMRFDLRIDGECKASDANSQGCVGLAVKLGVEWDEIG